MGGAQFCLDTAREYTRARQQFGGPISGFQATQFRVADMATSIQAGRAGGQGVVQAAAPGAFTEHA